MVHSKDGYAVIEWHYMREWTEEDSITPGREGWHERLQNVTVRVKSDLFSSTNWAKCDKNQTGDQYLSRWVKEVVYPEAENMVKRDIERLNLESINGRKAWLERENGKFVAQGQIPPVLRRYSAFDRKRLTMGSPYHYQSEPNFGLQKPWLSRPVIS